MILNGYSFWEEEFYKIFQNIPENVYMHINAIHNIEHREEWKLPRRQLDEYVLVYVRKGNGYYIIKDRKIEFQKGSILLISPKTPFSALGGEITPFLYSIRYSLRNNRNGEIWEGNDRALCIHYNGDKNYNEIFEKLYSAYIATMDVNIKRCLSDSILLEILCNLWNDIHEPNQSFDMKMNKAKVYIEKHPIKKHTIKELSNISGYSELYFSKRFKQIFGMTPKSFIFQMKMNYAKNLILEYSYTVKEVAYLLGYSDPYIFSNQFKKVFGTPPSSLSKIR